MYRRYAAPFRHGRGHLVAAAWRRNREVSMALIRRKIFIRSQVTPRDERPATSLGFGDSREFEDARYSVDSTTRFVPRWCNGHRL